ncbi:M1 family metallopeptidase [Dyadobacter sp. CY345]|uniref:M1 family metallopeptidase n=1 Tax=Dyadobacter sp. CY345 TaxID=2909335 RepID=UPI001F47D96B|nr:M1 family metallopeptidase [Dyadobacter sp. CY345]MCF2445662.1 M1 family metallopeptidase [Dyadobacter sp. CY345]
MLKKILSFCLILTPFLSSAQKQTTFTHADTLRGAITPERVWWDLTYYHLRVTPNAKDSTISGSTIINYKVLEPKQVIQVDLQEPLQIEKVIQDGQTLTYKRDGNAFFITLSKKQEKGKSESIEVFYSGRPRLAKRPPWDGGVQWVPDGKGNTIISTSCQGLGSSVWWPCKDHMYDEPDSMMVSITVPKAMTDVSNGKLRSVVENNDGTHTFNWAVVNPINNYGVNMNVAPYVSWSEIYKGEKGDLPVSFYVYPENLEKAKVQFDQANKMLKAFEHWFGPYPFYEDGYKLVEVPYLGMEHQSSVTYGNGYKMGYLGRDLSKTGWGLKWDFIIIHESGHEWFANNITYKDAADMWIHESFTNYSENLYTEFYFGKEAGADYVIGTRALIANDIPIIGTYNVNQEGSRDMYYKGGNMLHTIRQVVNDDEKWRQILRGLNKTFYHQTVETKQIEDYVNKNTGRDISKIFDQYLRDTQIPVLEYSFKGNSVQYRWVNVIAGFDMPVKIKLADGKNQFVYPTTDWKTLKTKGEKTLTVDRNFYVESKSV